MPGRFVPCRFLTPEFVAQLESEVEQMYLTLAANHNKTATLRPLIILEWSTLKGEVLGHMRIGSTNYQNKQSFGLGLIRDGHLVMEGTDILSDYDPEEHFGRDRDTVAA